MLVRCREGRRERMRDDKSWYPLSFGLAVDASSVLSVSHDFRGGAGPIKLRLPRDNPQPRHSANPPSPTISRQICEFHGGFVWRQRGGEMIVDSTLNLSWPVIGAALKVHMRETPMLKLDDPSTYVFKVTNQLPSSSSTNPKAFSERYITVRSLPMLSNCRTNLS